MNLTVVIYDIHLHLTDTPENDLIVLNQLLL